MSLRPTSRKNSCFSLRSSVSRYEKASSISNQECSSDESDYCNVGFHRSKCPWVRRQSFLNKFKKSSMCDNSVNSIQGDNQGQTTKKPWLLTSASVKSSDSYWRRPLGKTKSGINCFCVRQEQAKIAPPSKHYCTPGWIKARRIHIVNKFDTFSKRMLKVTGKLSQETISLITSKIKENLENSSSINLRNIYTSSVKIKNNLYRNMKDNNHIVFGQSSKISETSSIQVSLKASDLSLKEGCDNSASVIDSLNAHDDNDENVIESKKKSVRSRESSRDEIRSCVYGEDHSSKVKNSFNNIIESYVVAKIKPDINESTLGDNGTAMRNRKNNLNSGGFVVSDDKVTASRSRSIYICNKGLSSNTKKCLVERPASAQKKTLNVIKRPKSVGDKSLTIIETPKLRNDQTSQPIQRPSSGWNNYSCHRERSVMFSNNTYVNDNTLPNNEETIPSREKTQILHDSKSRHKTSQFFSRSVSFRKTHGSNHTLTNVNKPMSAGDKSSQLKTTQLTENKTLHFHERNVLLGDSIYVGDNTSNCSEKPMSAIEKTPQSILSSPSKIENSFLQEKSVSFGENIHISFDDSSSIDKPMMGLDEPSQPILNISSKIDTLPCVEKNISPGNNKFDGIKGSDIEDKSLTALRKSPTIAERLSSVSKTHFHGRTVSFSEDTVYIDDKPLSAEDQSLCNITHNLAEDKIRPTLAFQRKKQERNFVSKVDVMKSSLDVVKNLQPVLTKNINSVQSKKSLQKSVRRKVMIDRNIKKICVQPISTGNLPGYSVKLVQLHNYRKTNEDSMT